MPKRSKRPTLAEKMAAAHTAVEDLMFESPESSSINSGSYDPVSETMTVHFKTGKSYDYNPFPLKLWIEFAQAASKGKFFAERVRPIYAGRERT